jgi:ABC-type transport system involved in multi-copper enzyme maturation permease subunit
MTAGPLTPSRLEATSGPGGFGHLLHAEWTKFRTVRGWVIAVIVAVLLSLLLALFNASHSHVAPCTASPNGPACHYALPTGPGGEMVIDTFYFVHRPLAGDGSMTVQVSALTEVAESSQTRQGRPVTTTPTVVPWAKAGLIITAGPGQGSAYAAVMVTGRHGPRMQWNYTGDAPAPGPGAGEAGGASAPSPRWLRLARAGDVITGYDSADGTNWTKAGTVTLPGLAATVQAGMFVTSPSQPAATSSGVTSTSSAGGGATDATAAFDRVGLRGGWPGGSWTGTSVSGGPDSPYTAGHEAGYRQADGAFTVTGSGDIAPDVTHGVPVDALLVGLFIALAAVLVVGVQFMTAEYRRGLIRVTLAASPRRGRVLAAKAIVLGAVTFAAGLAGSGGAVLIGIPLLRASGNPVYPASMVTEARVITGTAALAAVFAVFALSVGAIVRHGAGAVTAAITGVILPYLLTAGIPVLPAGAADWVLRVSPAAGFAIRQIIQAYPQVAASYTPFNDYFPLPPWAGFAVTCAWAVLALALAACLLNRRDA